MPNKHKFKVSISRYAMEMLVSHARFLEHVSIDAADDLIDAYVQAATSLEEMPQRCQFLNDAHLPHNQYRKLLFFKRYMLIFTISDENVYIDYVIDCRQEYPWEE